MTYDVSHTNHVFNDHEALRQLMARCGAPGTRAILVGFGETTKHLVNLVGANIVAIYDPDPRWKGVHFRGIPVLDLPAKVDANLLVCCEFSLLYEYFGKVIRAYDWKDYFFPTTLNHRQTYEIKPFEQEECYKKILKDVPNAPLSMMSDEKLRFLLEFLRLGLTFDGDVIELGCWQGGSTWIMARALAEWRETRTLYALDLFELHQMDPWATMCTDEIKIRMREHYDRVVVISGAVDHLDVLTQAGDGPFCFAHVDLGYQEPSLDYIWHRLSRGAPLLLDNYGHIAAPTWRWDDFFAARGTRVTRLPWSEQGLVFKR